ncbi:hypothetical protein [Nocardia sp. CA-135398]|uniref:hypothetical protein n=1 Tax=Nocardia sp. CA-135398 TaxID=3239977 RepID=UPI003D9532E4
MSVVGSILHPFDTGRQLKLEPITLNVVEKHNRLPSRSIPGPSPSADLVSRGDARQLRTVVPLSDGAGVASVPPPAKSAPASEIVRAAIAPIATRVLVV